MVYVPPLPVVAELAGNSEDVLGVKLAVIPCSLSRAGMAEYAEALQKEGKQSTRDMVVAVAGFMKEPSAAAAAAAAPAAAAASAQHAS